MSLREDKRLISGTGSGPSALTALNPRFRARFVRYAVGESARSRWKRPLCETEMRMLVPGQPSTAYCAIYQFGTLKDLDCRP
jgi:hypothetical protein